MGQTEARGLYTFRAFDAVPQGWASILSFQEGCLGTILGQYPPQVTLFSLRFLDFKFQLINMKVNEKLKIQLSRYTGHISAIPWPRVANGHYVGEQRTFIFLIQKVLLDHTSETIIGQCFFWTRFKNNHDPEDGTKGVDLKNRTGKTCFGASHPRRGREQEELRITPRFWHTLGTQIFQGWTSKWMDRQKSKYTELWVCGDVIRYVEKKRKRMELVWVKVIIVLETQFEVPGIHSGRWSVGS